MYLSRLAITDTIGVTLAGLPEDATQIPLKTPGIATAPGKALVFGTRRRTSALDATFINGIAWNLLNVGVMLLILVWTRRAGMVTA